MSQDVGGKNIDQIKIYKSRISRKAIEIRGDIFSDNEYSFKNGELHTITILYIDPYETAEQLSDASGIQGSNYYKLNRCDRISINSEKALKVRDINVVLYSPKDTGENLSAAVLSFKPRKSVFRQLI